MTPTVRAATLAVGLACATLTAHADGAAAAQVTPRAYIGVTPPTDVAASVATARGPAWAPAPSALAEAPFADGALLPARLGMASLSLVGLGLYLRRRARRHA